MIGDSIRILLALVMATAAIAPNGATAVVIDDFDHGDGTPININWRISDRFRHRVTQ
jgi:hypothetical protein